MERSYKILVEYSRPKTDGTRRVATLYVCSTAVDLALLLQTLDASPTVAGLKVFTTITVPPLVSLNELTKSDLGLIDLEKMK